MHQNVATEWLNQMYCRLQQITCIVVFPVSKSFPISDTWICDLCKSTAWLLMFTAHCFMEVSFSTRLIKRVQMGNFGMPCSTLHYSPYSLVACSTLTPCVFRWVLSELLCVELAFSEFITTRIPDIWIHVFWNLIVKSHNWLFQKLKLRVWN